MTEHPFDTLDAALAAAGKQIRRATKEAASLRAGYDAGGEATEPPPVEPPKRFLGDPGVGKMYWGTKVDGGGPKLPAFEQQVGHTVGSFRAYYQSNQLGMLETDLANDVRNGRISVYSSKLPGSWADCAAGRNDDWLRTIVAAANRVLASHPDRPFLFCLHHEPRTDGPPEDFRAMYAHAIPILHECPNLLVTPIYNGFSFQPGGDPDPSIWKIDDADLQGIDIYPPHDTSFNKAKLTAWYDLTLDKLAAWGKPMVLAEWASRETGQGAYAPQLITDLYEHLHERGDVPVVTYYNSVLNINGPDGAMTLTGERLAHWTACLTGEHSAFLV